MILAPDGTADSVAQRDLDKSKPNTGSVAYRVVLGKILQLPQAVCSSSGKWSQLEYIPGGVVMKIKRGTADQGIYHGSWRIVDAKEIVGLIRPVVEDSPKGKKKRVIEIGRFCKY